MPIMTQSATLHAKKRAGKKRVRVCVTVPEARSVFITGSFCGWKPDCFPMKKDKHDQWKATLPVGPGLYEYRLLVDGNWRDDPGCVRRVPNPFGTNNCVLSVPEE